MDYEVFLVSRIHEEWQHRDDASTAVREGLANTGRVITAYAAVMLAVFTSFATGDDRILKLFGIAMATAVFLDAIVIRSILMPPCSNCSAAAPGHSRTGSTAGCPASQSNQSSSLPPQWARPRDDLARPMHEAERLTRADPRASPSSGAGDTRSLSCNRNWHAHQPARLEQRQLDAAQRVQRFIVPTSHSFWRYGG